MSHRIFFIASFLLSILSGCYGPQLQVPRGSQAQVEHELATQRELLLKRFFETNERLVRVSTALRFRAASLCGQQVKPFVGAIVMDQRIFSRENRELARRLFNLTPDDARIVFVIPDSPAAKAGLLSGDILTRVDGARISMADFMGKAPSQFALNLVEKAGGRAIPITIERQGRTHDLTLMPQMACRYNVHLVYDRSLNAYSDGERIIMPHEMVNFTDDDELAFVLSHELAHNLLGHIDRRRANAATGSLIGAIFDIGLAAAGVNTQGLGTRTGSDIGAKAYSQEFEFEADYLGIYLMAQAGFDISKSISFLRKLGIEDPSGVKRDFLATHPSYPERAATLESAGREIEHKLLANLPLIPEKIEPPGNPPPQVIVSAPIPVSPSAIAARKPAAVAVIAPTTPVASLQPATAPSPKPTPIFASLVQFDGPKIKYGITLEATLLEEGNGHGSARIIYPGNSNVLNGHYKSVAPRALNDLKILDVPSVEKLSLKDDSPWTIGVFSGADTVLECIFGSTAPLDQKRGTCKDNFGNRYNLVF